jgi:hypothetical protein
MTKEKTCSSYRPARCASGINQHQAGILDFSPCSDPAL